MDIEVGNYNEEEMKGYLDKLRNYLEARQEVVDNFKQKYGITLFDFLIEAAYVLEHSDMKNGTTTHGNVITADYLGIEIFIDKVVEEVKKYEEHR